jgi:hypothetical protein
MFVALSSSSSSLVVQFQSSSDDSSADEYNTVLGLQTGEILMAAGGGGDARCRDLIPFLVVATILVVGRELVGRQLEELLIAAGGGGDVRRDVVPFVVAATILVVGRELVGRQLEELLIAASGGGDARRDVVPLIVAATILDVEEVVGLQTGELLLAAGGDDGLRDLIVPVALVVAGELEDGEDKDGGGVGDRLRIGLEGGMHESMDSRRDIRPLKGGGAIRNVLSSELRRDIRCLVLLFSLLQDSGLF